MNIWKLILIVLGIFYLLGELAYRRWIRPDCGLSEAELDCAHCRRPCAAPVGTEDATGFHLVKTSTTDLADFTDGKTTTAGSGVPALPLKGRWSFADAGTMLLRRSA
jgi:hypothetical protein